MAAGMASRAAAAAALGAAAVLLHGCGGSRSQAPPAFNPDDLRETRYETIDGEKVGYTLTCKWASQGELEDVPADAGRRGFKVILETSGGPMEDALTSPTAKEINEILVGSGAKELKVTKNNTREVVLGLTVKDIRRAMTVLAFFYDTQLIDKAMKKELDKAEKKDDQSSEQSSEQEEDEQDAEKKDDQLSEHKDQDDQSSEQEVDEQEDPSGALAQLRERASPAPKGRGAGLREGGRRALAVGS